VDFSVRERLEKGVQQWDNPSMTLTADDKGRLTCSQLFTPGTRFEAEKDEKGRIVLTRLVKQTSEAKLVKPITRRGLLVLPGEPDEEAIVQEVKEEREKLNARLLG
jgi:hypothetical protein